MSALTPANSVPRRSALMPAFLVGAGLLFFSAAALFAAIPALKWYTHKLPIQAKFACSNVRGETTSWKPMGADRTMSEEVLETLGTQNYVQRAYFEKNPPADRGARQVDFHLAYYTGMVDTVPHVPDRCFVAGGDQLAGGPDVVPIPLRSADWLEDPAATTDTRAATGEQDAVIFTAEREDTMERVRLPRGIDHLDLRVFSFTRPGVKEKIYSGYFFIANGGLTSSAQNVRLLAFDLKSDYAYYLKVQFTAAGLKGPEELGQIASSMLDELLPDIMQCVPDWTEVIRGNYPADNPRRLKQGTKPGA